MKFFFTNTMSYCSIKHARLKIQIISVLSVMFFLTYDPQKKKKNLETVPRFHFNNRGDYCKHNMRSCTST